MRFRAGSSGEHIRGNFGQLACKRVILVRYMNCANAMDWQLEGKIGIDLEERLPTFTYRFLEIPLTLWEKGATDEKAPPFAMQFKIDLPETFTDGEGKEHPLPPSYELDSNSLDDFHVQCSYTVSVRMARSRFLPSKLCVVAAPSCSQGPY